jgi:hypothetical protein
LFYYRVIVLRHRLLGHNHRLQASLIILLLEKGRLSVETIAF